MKALQFSDKFKNTGLEIRDHKIWMVCFSCLFILVYLGLALRLLSEYFITDYIVWTALCLSPYIISPDINKAGSHKYLWISLVFILLTLISGVKTFFFLSVGFSILFVVESLVGSIGHLPFFLLGLLSPTFKYFNNMLGFPVRLRLSEWAGSILRFMGYSIEVNGNVLVLNGTEFSVDPACVGLKMMAVSLLTGLLILAYFQRLYKKQYSFLRVCGIMILIISLNIFSNLIRIILLTVFEILPENPWHNLVGTICFILYIILPSYFFIRWMAGIATRFNNYKPKQIKGFSRSIVMNTILLITIITAGLIKINPHKNVSVSTPNIALSGYSKEIVQGDILKFEKTNILIYIKPIQSFYGAEHSPMICWIGSGYTFKQINKQMLCNREIYTGILQKNEDRIFTAWWFDTGTFQTNSQLQWRWRAIQGEQFYLVNINSVNAAVLQKEIRQILEKNELQYLANITTGK